MTGQYLPYVGIRPGYLYTYSSYEGPRRRSVHSSFSLNNERPKPSGYITTTARRRISNIAEWFFWICRDPQYVNLKKGTYHRFKCAFITLTLPAKQRHSDELIKSTCLNQFFIEIKKKFYVEHYLWRAEKQGNGNIHFHILVDRFIHYSLLRAIWNRLTEKLGYVTEYQANQKEFYKNGFKPRPKSKTREEIARDYRRYIQAKAQDFRDPNSTDIHGVFQIRNLKNYIQKYIGKNAEGQDLPVSGKLWDCSATLKKLKGATGLISSSVSRCIDWLYKKLPDKFKAMDHCDIYRIGIDELVKFNCFPLLNIVSGFIEKYFPPPSAKNQHSIEMSYI